LVRSQLIHFLWTDYNSFILVLSSLSQAYFPVFLMKFSGHCHSAQKYFFLFVLSVTFSFCFSAKFKFRRKNFIFCRIFAPALPLYPGRSGDVFRRKDSVKRVQPFS